MKVALKELLLKLLGDRIEHKVVEITATATSGMHSWTVPIGLPSTAKILSITIMRLPNPNWIYADIANYDTNNVVISYNNTYSGNITETLQLSILYRL